MLVDTKGSVPRTERKIAEEKARDYARRELAEQVRPGRRIFRIPLAGFARRR